ncbi:hypothetical protein C9374_004089 [Naegleria lovaniensis]|uniref:Uncharacterized protein n=1 Tax=Naegleria lovaniensis TaxID=51637 RepID=A0AA88KKT5_NAELO|nr:uncharacterized protein C9374_004089 [Naegleria lovaniensis]KAG2383418.1 hypothetical protein C9374_004089 [Naegleria lovaniensis]
MSNTSDSNDTLQYMQNNIRKELFESELFDSEVFSKQDQAMSLYLFVKNGCNTKALELQVKQFDQARFRNRETKFDDEISSLFESLCVTKELFGTPPCLKRYEQTSFLHDSFTAST